MADCISSAEPHLLDHHREHLHKSGLTDETIAAARIYSVTDPAEAAKLLNWQGTAPAPSIAFPVYEVTGELVMTVLRPDTPFTRKDGSAPPKYETPKRVEQAGAERRPSVPLYFPPSPLVAADEWKDTSKPILFTEGIKKALAAAQAGQLCVAAMGVTLFHDIDHKDKTREWRLHPDLKSVPLKGRVVYVAFDSDLVEKPAVALAEARLARMLLDAGAIVKVVRIPAEGDNKVGLDDYLVKQTDPKVALKALMDAADEGDPILRAKADAATGGAAVQKLLDDLGFQAALDVGGQVVIDLTAKALKPAGITKDAIKEKLDSFHARQRVKPKESEPKTEQLDPVVEAKAKARLESPDLKQQFLAFVARLGLVGEQNTALVLLLAMITRKTRRPLHVVIKAISSTGKNYTLGKVTILLPPGELEEISDMSAKALLYRTEPLSGKVIVFVEVEGSQNAEYTTRVAMSEGKLTAQVVEKVEDEDGTRFETHKKEVEALASFIFTTTRPELNSENESRLFELTLDESEEQTRRVVAAQARLAANPPSPIEQAAIDGELEIWRAALRLLEPLEVRIPDAEKLAEGFSTKQVRARRDFPKLLGLVAAHALLFQRQRKVVDGCLVAEQADIDTASQLARSLSGAVPPAMDKKVKRLREELGTVAFTPARAADVLGCSVDHARRQLKGMEDHELVEVIESGKGNSGGLWKVKGFLTPTLPKPAALLSASLSSPPTLPSPTVPSPIAPSASDSATLPDISTGRTDPSVTTGETTLSDCPTTGNGVGSTLLEFPDGEMPYRYVENEDYEERAAIMQYEGGLSRHTAEEEAKRQTRRVTKRPSPEVDPRF